MVIRQPGDEFLFDIFKNRDNGFVFVIVVHEMLLKCSEIMKAVNIQGLAQLVAVKPLLDEREQKPKLDKHMTLLYRLLALSTPSSLISESALLLYSRYLEEH
jgi:hypothetical protein